MAFGQTSLQAARVLLESLKDFLKRIGSNLRLSGRALRVAYENPWAILARYRPPAAPSAAPEAENEKWWTILTEARTFFERREP